MSELKPGTLIPRREVHPQEPCWLDYGPEDRETGIQLRSCQARIVSADSVIGADGRQYVAVSAYELGGVRIMAVDDLRFYDRGPGKGRAGQCRSEQ